MLSLDSTKMVNRKLNDNKMLIYSKLNLFNLDKMIMLPTREKFVEDIMGIVNRITRSIINASKILDLEGVLRDMEKYGFNIIKYFEFNYAK